MRFNGLGEAGPVSVRRDWDVSVAAGRNFGSNLGVDPLTTTMAWTTTKATAGLTQLVNSLRRISETS